MLKRKRISSILLALVMLFSVIFALPKQALAATDFDDVGKGHIFYPFVNYVKSKGYVDGYGDGNYGPDDLMTRAQVAKLLVNAAGIPVNENAKNTNAFPDTNGHALEPWIVASKEGKIFDGDKAGNFNPEDNILRGQAAKVVVNALSLELREGKAVNFSDVPANHTFAEDIAILSSQGIVSGYQGKFDPEAKLTRGQFAKYIANADTIPAALAAVETAEESGSQADLEAAQALVNDLPDPDVKAALLARLAVVQAEIDQAGEALAAAKAAKKAEIDAFALNTEGMTEESIALAEAKLAELKETAKEAVDALETIEEVEAYEFDASEAEELLVSIEEQDLAAAKAGAKAELNEYVNAEDYTENADALAAAIEAGEAAIDAATTLEEVEQALADAKAAIDGIKSDAQIVEEVSSNVLSYIGQYYRTWPRRHYIYVNKDKLTDDLGQNINISFDIGEDKDKAAYKTEDGRIRVRTGGRIRNFELIVNVTLGNNETIQEFNVRVPHHFEWRALEFEKK